MRRPRQVWFVSCPGAELLDLSGSWAVLGFANEVTGRASYATQLLTPFGGDIRTRHGLVLAGARSLQSMSTRAMPDVLVIAGGPPTGTLPRAESRLVSWLSDHYRRIPTLVSICLGGFVLAEAGLLNGRRATTHWRYLDVFQRRFPEVHVVDKEIFVRDGSIWTSAGILAGIDLMLALVEQHHGPAVATKVANALVLFLRRSGRQPQFSPLLKRQTRDSARLRDLSAFILERLDEPLTLDRLARAMALTTRTLTRWCREDFGETPATYVRRLRLEEALRLLESTRLPLKAIAERTGLGHASTLWRLLTRELGITPTEYRARFSGDLRTLNG